jgi:hypothetical protein
VQGRQAVGEPGDGVRLPGPGRVLHQVRAARALVPGGRLQAQPALLSRPAGPRRRPGARPALPRRCSR